MPFYLGLDLGQSADYTALAVVHKVDVYDSDTGEFREELRLRHLERLALRTPYPDIVEHVVALLRREELHPWEVDRRRSKRQTHPTLVVDNTGVGAPVTDLFTKKKVKFVGVTITGGTSVTRLGAYKYGVPKRDLVSALEVPFHAGEFIIAEDLELRPTLEKELQGFKRKIKLDTGHDSYEHWREGDHDDLVLACAVATWWARLRRGNTRLRLIR
jgi:hypothetical protein